VTTLSRERRDAPPGTPDPLRLCVYTTVALLAWLLGPVVVVAFGVAGFAAYRAARRGGLTRSRCVLRDTRLVLAYLGLAVVAGGAGVAWQVAGWLR
jgi:hypothetical protein